MATGAGWQQYYSPAAGNPSSGAGKYNSGSSSTMSYQSGITMEYTQDLHLKMSKKIAQLTKVRIVTVIDNRVPMDRSLIRCCDAAALVKARVLRRQPSPRILHQRINALIIQNATCYNYFIYSSELFSSYIMICLVWSYVCKHNIEHGTFLQQYSHKSCTSAQ